MSAQLAEPERHAHFLAMTNTDEPAGFVEATIRRDYVNGTNSSPVGFLEGIYVMPAFRRQGVARALVDAVKTWTRQQRCNQLASDALLDNASSHHMHRALGFVETERVIYFCMPLDREGRR